MTVLCFEEDGIDVEYAGTVFRLDRDLVEAATGKGYFEVTDHEVFQIVEEDPPLSGEPRQIRDIM